MWNPDFETCMLKFKHSIIVSESQVILKYEFKTLCFRVYFSEKKIQTLLYIS